MKLKLIILLFLFSIPMGGRYQQQANAQEKTTHYFKILKFFNQNYPGYGLDTGQKKDLLHYPMAYSVYASAEAHRASATKDKSAEKNAIHAARWLIKNNDLNGDKNIGWGLPFAWDAGRDGTKNPAHTEYAITSALALQALLDVWSLLENNPVKDRDFMQLLLDSAIGLYNTFENKFDATPHGIIFWYSTQPCDNFHISNTHAMLTGQFARLTDYPIPENLKKNIQSKCTPGIDYLKHTVQKDKNGIFFWHYEDDIPATRKLRSNDAVHTFFVWQGIHDYQIHNQGKPPFFKIASMKQSLQRCLEKTWVREFPRDGEYPASYKSALDREARLFGIGGLLYFSARLGDLKSAKQYYQILVKRYMKKDGLLLRPDLKGTNFYPRQAAFALLGMSYYCW